MKTLALAPTLLCLLALAVPATASADSWVGAQAPLDTAVTSSELPNDGPATAVIGGRLHAAWSEFDGVNREVAVARLDADGVWRRLGSGASPINRDATKDAFHVDLADRDGAPLVAWTERDANRDAQIRVAEYDAGSGTWAEIVGGDRPINPRAGRPMDPGLMSAHQPHLAVHDGRPYVGFLQDTPVEYEAYVSRLSEDGASWQALPKIAGNRATMVASAAGDVWAVTRYHSGGGWLQRLDEDAGRFEIVSVVPGDYNGGPLDLEVHEDELYVLGEAEPRLARWDEGSGSWDGVGPALPVGGPRSLTFAGGRPHVAMADWQQDGFPSDDDPLRVLALGDSGSWEPLGGPLGPIGGWGPGEAELASLGGRPYVGWTAADDRRVRVAGWLADDSTEQPDDGGTGVVTPPPAGSGQPPHQQPQPPKRDESDSTAPPAATPGRRARKRPALALRSRKVRPRRGGRIMRPRVTCDAPRWCRGVAVARAGRKVVARGKVRLRAGQTKRITMRITKPGRRMLLRGARRYRLVLVSAGRS